MTRLERRLCERFTVPGATVEWKAATDASFVSSGCPLGDLSRGGARFLSPSPPRVGTVLRLSLTVPGDPPLSLIGRVVWTQVSSGQIHNVAVAFAPPGDAPGANEPGLLGRLLAIEGRFLKPRA